MNLVPLGISENTEDDAGSAESGGQADEGAKDKSAAHKKKGENQDLSLIHISEPTRPY